MLLIRCGWGLGFIERLMPHPESLFTMFKMKTAFASVHVSLVAMPNGGPRASDLGVRAQ